MFNEKNNLFLKLNVFGIHSEDSGFQKHNEINGSRLIDFIVYFFYFISKQI